MESFNITPNYFLNQQVQAFYHADYKGYLQPGNPEYILKFKNTYNDNTKSVLEFAKQELLSVLLHDLPSILKDLNHESLFVCVVPRAKASYQPGQLYFKDTVSEVVQQLNGFVDGTNSIVRKTNTKTTHLGSNTPNYINDGDSPYPGITAKTCNISRTVKDKDILLIDDIYTKTINIDEDAIQTLFNCGARSVVLYAVAKTIKNRTNRSENTIKNTDSVAKIIQNKINRLDDNMKYTDNAIKVLTTRIYKGIGRAWIIKNMTPNMDEKAIISLLNNGAKVDYHVTLEDFENKKNIVKKLLKEQEGKMDGVVAIGDVDFPKHYGKVKNSEKPIFLFYRGNLQLLQEANKNVAVIGLLKPDKEIEEIEKEVVAKLVNNGATIVSGLALGCDSIAHRQALNSNGKTIAIIPSPLSNILPEINKDLALEIIKNDGLIITEYLTEANSKMEFNGRYQERDRLQALYSNCIILSASYAKNEIGNDSGSRLAMGYAMDYKIPRAVIYNPNENTHDPKYDLNRQCIGEDKEITIINRDNLIEALNKISSLRPVKENHSEQASFLLV